MGATVEFNPKGYVGGALSDELRLTYGATRFEIDADYAKRDLAVWKLTCGRAQASATFRYIHGAAFDLKYGGAAEVFCLPKRWGGSGLFLRYVNGQDYYNVNFQQRIRRLTLLHPDQVRFGGPVKVILRDHHQPERRCLLPLRRVDRKRHVDPVTRIHHLESPSRNRGRERIE